MSLTGCCFWMVKLGSSTSFHWEKVFWTWKPGYSTKHCKKPHVVVNFFWEVMISNIISIFCSKFSVFFEDCKVISSYPTLTYSCNLFFHTNVYIKSCGQRIKYDMRQIKEGIYIFFVCTAKLAWLVGTVGQGRYGRMSHEPLAATFP